MYSCTVCIDPASVYFDRCMVDPFEGAQVHRSVCRDNLCPTQCPAEVMFTQIVALPDFQPKDRVFHAAKRSSKLDMEMAKAITKAA